MKWNANRYKSDFSFVYKYGDDVIKLIDKEAQLVLDIGCGNGALTKRLFEEGFEVIGLDADDGLLQMARDSYPELTFIKADARDFELKNKVDAVFSNAVFHWIDSKNQLRMLECIYNSLKEGGQLVFEFGGYGNVGSIDDELSKVFKKWGYVYATPFYFPTIGQYSALLEKIGFEVKYAILFERITELKGENGLADWIDMFIKNPFENICEKQKRDIINEVVDNLHSKLFINNVWNADYVRLRMKAIKK